ncbi:hypothetical protein [Nocardia sp. NPDC004711]
MPAISYPSPPFLDIEDRLPLDTSRVGIENLGIEGPDGNKIPVSVYELEGVTGRARNIRCRAAVPRDRERGGTE